MAAALLLVLFVDGLEVARAIYVLLPTHESELGNSKLKVHCGVC